MNSHAERLLRELETEIDRLTVYRNQKHPDPRMRGRPSPHKPLLLLIALRRAVEGRPRLMRFDEVEHELDELLRMFGNKRGPQSPNMPFVRLKAQDFWDLPERDHLPYGKSGSVSAEHLKEHGVVAGFKPEFHELVRDPRMARRITDRIVALWIEPADRVAVAAATGWG